MTIRLDDEGERYSGERALIDALRAGDEAAFLALVERHTPAMQKLARAYVRDDAAAEDVVQDAWVGVLRGIAAFEGRSSLKSWILTIVVNRAKTRGVRDARTIPFSALAHDEATRDDPSVSADHFATPGEEWPGHWRAEPAPWGDRPEERLLSDELRGHIDRAIDALPPAQRAVVLLRDVGGVDTVSICNVLELSETNVRVLLHRGRAKVRRHLDPYVAEVPA